MSDTKRREDLEGDVRVKERSKTQKPKLYKVLLHNDDYTTMEFVTEILIEIFHKTATEATQLMLHVHTRGAGIAGVYTRDIAETKVAKVHQRARDQGMPLLCTMEAE